MLSMLKSQRWTQYQKEVEQFDFLIKDQTDGLIDNDKLLSMFLTVYYDLGLT